jgi:predicted nucleic-acid-binding Zn-ribbon protein
MESKVCYVCGKENLNKNEIGLTKKLFDKNAKRFYCLNCLAEYLEVDTEFLLEKVEEFKTQGCILF